MVQAATAAVRPIGPGALVETENLAFAHPGHPVLAGASFRVAPGGACALIGPSGCGKTSLLHLLAGLLSPTAGAIRINGRPLSGPRPRTAIILQQLGLFPWKTVQENLALGLAADGLRGEGRHRRSPPMPSLAAVRPVEAMMRRLGLTQLARRYPHQLSGGQRQRVAIGRSLLANPDLLLMDEAASALDALTREHFQDLLLELWRDGGLTLLLVTHSIEEAVTLGRSLLVMDHGGQLETMDNPVPGGPEHPRDHGAFADTCRRLRARLAASATPEAV